MNGTIISSLAILAVIMVMLSFITVPLLLGSVIYLVRKKSDEKTKKKLKLVLLILVGFYLVTVLFSLSVNKFGLGSREDRLDYVNQNELGKLFLEYHPEAQTEFNAAGDTVTLKYTEGNNSIYIPVPAIEYREGDGGILYCAYDPGNEDIHEVVFEVADLEEMREKLESNECFNN